MYAPEMGIQGGLREMHRLWKAGFRDLVPLN